MTIPLFEMKISKKPIAVIKTGDRNISFIKINKYNSKYFATKDGLIFELDDEYEYRYKNTGLYFYNFSNSKPISLTAMSEIENVIKREGESELFNKERFMNTVGDDPSIDVGSLNIPKDVASELSGDTKRFLQDHSTDDETAKTDMMIKVHTQKKSIPYYSSPLLGMGMNRGGFAFVQTGYQRLDVVPMHVHDNRAYTQYGVFEVDKDNVYFLKKQMVCFFVISEEKESILPPMPRKDYSEMKTMVKKKRWSLLESFHTPVPKGMKPENNIKKKAIPKSVSISSEKKLIQYQADSPSVCHTTMKELYLTKEAVATKLADNLKKAIPIIVIFGGLMGFVMLLSNLPPIIDTVADRVVGKPELVVMTPEEYEQWEIDNGLKTEEERVHVAKPPDLENSLIPEDLEPPIMIIPEQTVFEADNTNGMRVKYVVGVTDNVDSGLIAECSPRSNAVLGIGDHMISCTATDSSGNMSEMEFMITVNVREGVKPSSIIPNIAPPQVTPLPPMP